MKKLISLFALMTVCFTAFAQSLPAFSDKENAVVFDAKTLKEDYSDYCKVINLTNEKDLSFDIYIMKANKKEWTLAGTATVNGVLDTSTLESEFNGGFNRFRYFAVVPKDDRTYNVQMSYDEIDMYVVEHHFIAFLVDTTEDTDAAIRNNSTIIDIDSISGKYKDNIRIESQSNDTDIDFVIFGFDNPDATKWEAVGKSHIKGNGDGDFVEATLHDVDIKKCKFYGLYAMNGKKYEVETKKSHNDLYITIK